MEKLFKVLYAINKDRNKSQRDIATEVGLSIGTVNTIIRKLESEGFIIIDKMSNKFVYTITNEGYNVLEISNNENQLKKIKINDIRKNKISQAVILGAGYLEDFDCPVGFLYLGNDRIIDRMIKLLNKNGIEDIIIVAGYKYEYYEELAKKNNKIKIVINNDYKNTGTMKSLSLANKYIKNDFLLLESDIVFEEIAIIEALNHDCRDCMIITNLTGSGDEVLAEIRDGYVYKIGKDIHQFNKIDGEIMGITKISIDIYKKMLKELEHNENPYVNYEYTLMDVGRRFDIGYKKIDDLVWFEVDTKKQYNKLISNIYSYIK